MVSNGEWGTDIVWTGDAGVGVRRWDIRGVEVGRQISGGRMDVSDGGRWMRWEWDKPHTKGRARHTNHTFSSWENNVAGESDGVGKMTWLGGEKMDNVNSW